jgi:hypothetical protein
MMRRMMDMLCMERTLLFARTTALLFAALPGLGLNSDDDTDDEGANNKRQGRRDKARNRVRCPVSSIFREHGPYYVRRAYRMTEGSFWELLRLLEPHMGSVGEGVKVKAHKNGGKNGLISNEFRLSAAIRYFAGGRPEDNAISHGISHSEVLYSCWKVVGDVNNCPELAFSYLDCHTTTTGDCTCFQGEECSRH